MSVRISDKEKKDILQYGTLSEAVREGIKLYLSAKKSRELFHNLGELQQKNRIRTTLTGEVKLIKEDRNRR